MTASRVSPCLPPEIVEKIIGEAWSQTATTRERWDLYTSLRDAHPLMHELLVGIVVRRPFFMFSASDWRDIELYRTILEVAERARNAAEHSPVPGAGALSLPDHVIIDITPSFDHDEREEGGTPYILKPCWKEYSIALEKVVPRDCPSVTLLATTWVESHLCRLPGLDLLSSFSAITHLYLNYGSAVRSPRYMWLGTVKFFPTVRFLRIKEYPSCGFREPRSQFLHAFPNMQHLHLDEPTILKWVDPPPSLHTVTLEAPPRYRIAGGAPFGSIVGYNVPTALRRGFLRSSTSRSPPTIIVHTGPAAPGGFEDARLACAGYGVVLRRDIVYMM